MIGEVELRLVFPGRVVFIVAVVGPQGNEAGVAGFHAMVGEIDDDGQVAAFVLRHPLAVHKHLLLAHHRLEMHGDGLACHVGRHGETLAIPAYALIVAASTGIGGFQTYWMGGAHHLP